MSIGAFPKRGTGLKMQLRTGNELAREFGIHPMELGRLLHNYYGPKQVRTIRNTLEQKTYFDARAVREWWASVKDKVQ